MEGCNKIRNLINKEEQNIGIDRLIKWQVFYFYKIDL